MSDQIQNNNFMTVYPEEISSTADLMNDYQNPQDMLNDTFNDNIQQPIPTIELVQPQPVQQIVQEPVNNTDLPFDIDENTTFLTAPNNIVQTSEPIKEEEKPKSQNTLKDNFFIALDSFKVLKDITANLMYRDGIAYFVTNTNKNLCEFNSNCSGLNFDFSNIAGLGIMENLTKRETLTYTEIDDGKTYVFTDGKFKFNLRKATPPLDNTGKPLDVKRLYLAKKNDFYTKDKTKNLLASYEFTDKTELSVIINTIKSLKSSGNLNVYSNNGKLIISSGNLSVNGEFILLELPYNTNVYSKIIKTELDPACLRLDYASLKLDFYYINHNGNDKFILFSNGILKVDNFSLNCIQSTYTFK